MALKVIYLRTFRGFYLEMAYAHTPRCLSTKFGEMAPLDRMVKERFEFLSLIFEPWPSKPMENISKGENGIPIEI